MSKTSFPKKAARVMSALSLFSLLCLNVQAADTNEFSIQDVNAYKLWLAQHYGAIPAYDNFSGIWALKPIARSIQTYGLMSFGRTHARGEDLSYFRKKTSFTIKTTM